MVFGISYRFVEKYLPNSRCKTPQKREMVTVEDVEVRCLGDDAFPIAAITEVYGINKVYRWDGKNWYMPSASPDCEHLMKRLKFAALSATEDKLSDEQQPVMKTPSGKDYVEGTSIIIDNDRAARVLAMKNMAKNFVIFNGLTLWERCGQPCYIIDPYKYSELFYVTQADTLSCQNTFLATEKEKALEFANKILPKDKLDKLKALEYDAVGINIVIPEAYTLGKAYRTCYSFEWNEEEHVYEKHYGYGNDVMWTAKFEIGHYTYYAYSSNVDVYHFIGRLLLDVPIRFQDILSIKNECGEEFMIKKGAA